MSLKQWLLSTAGVLLLLAGLVTAQSTVYPRTDIWDFKNGLRINGRVMPPIPATQTIAAAGTIASDACGTVKRVTAAGAVTTSTTATFTAPDGTNNGCVMTVCNIGVTNTITLDRQAAFFTLAAADLALAANTCVLVGNDGVEWRQLTGLLTAS